LSFNDFAPQKEKPYLSPFIKLIESGKVESDR
jgi:hypothetical protein